MRVVATGFAFNIWAYTSILAGSICGMIERSMGLSANLESHTPGIFDKKLGNGGRHEMAG